MNLLRVEIKLFHNADWLAMQYEHKKKQQKARVFSNLKKRGFAKTPNLSERDRIEHLTKVIKYRKS